MAVAVRNYSMTDAELMLFASNLVQTITNDLAQFAQFGVDADAVQDFKDLGDDFEDFPPDQFYLTDIGVATEEKDETRKQLILETRKISNRALMKWGEDSMKYKKFGVAGLSEMTDKSLLATSRLVVLAAEKYLSELASDGLTQPIIDSYKALSELFEQKLNSISDANEIRDNKKQARISLGNQLYALLTKYCTFGKSIWADVDEAKFNNYIIYTTTSPGSLTAPQNFMFDPVNYDFRWSAVENATSYILQSSTDGSSWTQYWSGTALMAPYEESPDTMMYFRVLARNAGGNGPASDVISYDFAPSLPAPQNFSYISQSTTFAWSVVPNSEYYEFQYRAQTTPVWSSLNAGDATIFYHADPVGNYLARVRAVSGTTFGAWSNELEYTVTPPQPD